MKDGRYKDIEEYGVIGDLHTVALVATDGSIDWCCLPHFDSPSVFAAILDADKGGFFRIAPKSVRNRKQMYLPDSCLLVNRFYTEDGVAELTDFMPVASDEAREKEHHEIVRRVRTVRGKVRLEIECAPAFDYARGRHDVRIERRGAIFESPGHGTLGLTSPVRLRARGGKAVGTVELKTHEQAVFVLRWCPKDADARPLAEDFDAERSFRDTLRFWHDWCSRCKYHGRWRETVLRSAMTLKLLTYVPTGAILAAATTSLPERIGGRRNFDYRFTWIRDAAFTVYAFLRLGLTSEADAFMRWVHARAHELGRDGRLQVMYGIEGKHDLRETELGHLDGYRGSKPVRIGNDAFDQLQLDIYGELMDSVYLSNKYGRPVSYDDWLYLTRLLDRVTKVWRRKDAGIWEVRGGRRHFVYSKLMCWVALDRGIRLAEKRSFPGPLDSWRKNRDRIYREIMRRGWNEKEEAFVQYYGTKALDAANLMMPLTFFISPTDPRMLKTLDKTKQRLSSDGLVHRYQIGEGAEDGFAGPEGTFSMCSFWYVEALTRAGRLREARFAFENMLAYANHLGLYSEQIGPHGELLGNFPQAFTHLGLISAAYNLDRALDKQGSWRSAE